MVVKTKLDEICSIKGRIGYRGYTKQDLVTKGNGAISLSPSNIKENKLIFEKITYISWKKYEESPEIMVHPGDIIFCKTASIGKMAFIDSLPEKATLNPQFVVLKDIKCLNKFLFYSMMELNFQKQIKSIISGTAIPTLSQKNLGQTFIFLPSPKEQSLVVKQLDDVFKKIDRAKNLVDLKIVDTKKLKKSILSKFLTDNNFEKVKLGELAKVVGGNGFPKELQGFLNKDIPFFKVSDMNLKENKINMKVSNNTVNLKDLENIGAKIYPKGTIIFPKIGGAISTNKKRILSSASAFDNNIMGLVPNKKILSEYLYKIFLTIDLYDLSNKAGLPSINKTSVEEIEILLPALIDQKKIVDKIDKIFDEVEMILEDTNKIKNNYLELESSILTKKLNHRESA